MNTCTNNVPRHVFAFWTGDNAMSDARKRCLESMRANIGVEVRLYTKGTIASLQLANAPFHEAYQFLSETHKADYLRVYCMLHYGGGYSDIKHWDSSWIHAFDQLENSNAVAIGYAERDPGWVNGDAAIKATYRQLIGTCAFIFKSGSSFCEEWMARIHAILDSKHQDLKLHPATYAQDHLEKKTGYPIAWSEILGAIFHSLQYDHRGQNMFLTELPMFTHSNYR